MQQIAEIPQISFVDKLKSIPATFGIRLSEEPEYHVIRQSGDFEIRHYTTQTRVEVTLSHMKFDSFRRTAFNKLASYIFGGNKQNKKISMTAPVLQNFSKPGSRTMSFILPSEYSLQSAPKSSDKDIKIIEVKAQDVVVISYSGNNTSEKMRLNEKKLIEWIRKQADLVMVDRPYLAQYDAPFVIPFLKKNELMVVVKNKNGLIPLLEEK